MWQFEKRCKPLSCYHPLKAFTVGTLPSGKADLKICSYEVDHVERDSSGTLVSSIYKDRGARAEHVYRDFVEIPCGHCLGCRVQYSREWANRCLLEAQMHDSAYFVTLTYNDDHVPRSYYDDPDTGEAFQALTLRKRDLQLFFKRLRKAVVVRDGKTDEGSAGIRYFACGEYGSHTYRPHYHAIIFGLSLADLTVVKKTKLGDALYTSEWLQRIWSTSQSKGGSAPLMSVPEIGFVSVAPCTWETCAYTARYVVKKAQGQQQEFYDMHNIEPEFCVMSRRPGIGRPWFDAHPGINPNDYINIATEAGGKKFRPPKYYNRLYDAEFPEKSAELKEIRRRMAEDARDLKLSKTNLSYLELLAVEERNFSNKINSLKRSDM
nr:replication initiation protein [Microvirus sp.]